VNVKRHFGTVLLVEDNPVLGFNQQDFLENAGYRCFLAETVRRAWRIIQCQPVGLLLCDHDLPDGKGVTLIERLRAGKLDLPVLYLTAAGERHLPQKVREFSCVKEILTKPVTPEKLLKEVKTWMDASTAKTYPRLVGEDERRLLLSIPA